MILLTAVTGLLSAGTAGGCLPVSGDPIRASDLAPVFAGFAGQTTPVSPAPRPGSRREISPAEIERVAARTGLALGQARGVCFEWRLEALEAGRIRRAIEAALPPGAGYDLVDFSRAAVPAGDVVFSRPGLGLAPHGSESPVLWRGFLVYGPRLTVPLWARVRVWIERKVLVAARAIPSGRPIEAGDVVCRPARVFPYPPYPLSSEDEAGGKRPRRPIAAGETVYANLLSTPPEIRTGDKVWVRVESGAALVTMEAKAVTSARTGDAVQLRNPSSGRRFSATAKRKGEAVVHLDSTGDDGVGSGGSREAPHKP